MQNIQQLFDLFCVAQSTVETEKGEILLLCWRENLVMLMLPVQIDQANFHAYCEFSAMGLLSNSPPSHQ